MEEEEVGDDPNDSYEARAKKRKLARKKAMAIAMRAQEEERLAMLEEEARQAKNQQDGINNEQRNRINSIVEQGANLDSVTMDEAGIKKTLLSFEKKTTRNQELRIKFPDQPEKFMESEMELNDALQVKSRSSYCMQFSSFLTGHESRGNSSQSLPCAG